MQSIGPAHCILSKSVYFSCAFEDSPGVLNIIQLEIPIPLVFRVAK